MKPFLKDAGFDDKQRKKIYGVSEDDFSFVATPEEADVGILPMTWNYYCKTGKTALALGFINSAALKGKKILVYNAGDFGLKMPVFENVLVFRLGGYLSHFRENERIIPPFIEDPLNIVEKKDISKRAYHDRPVVGFCGWTNDSSLNAVKEKLRILWRNFRFIIRLKKEEPQQIISSTYLRGLILKKLENSKKIETNFIKRKKYRAGVKVDKRKHSTTLEYYKNIADSDYTLCVRGTGNFSVRLYETLAMGRIPVYINTDSKLPLEEKIAWKKHMVWVEQNEVDLIDEKIYCFHHSLSPSAFKDLQEENRKLWANSLRLKGFFENSLLQEMSSKNTARKSE